MLRLAAIAALALLGSTPYWLTVGGIDSSGNQHALLVNDAGQVQLTMAGKLATVQLSAVDAGQPFWNLLGGIDYVGNQYPVVGGIGKSAYLIPETGTVLTHVNAVDLNAGTAKVGTPWTKNGTVPYNSSATPRPSVGVFSDTNYFSSTLSLPAPPYTVAILINTTSTAAGPVILTAGSTAYAQLEGEVMYVTSTGTVVSALPANGVFTVLMLGVDGSGISWSQANNLTIGSASAAGQTALANMNLGRYTSNGYALTAGDIFEVMISTAVPSSAAFSTLYNAVIAAE